MANYCNLPFNGLGTRNRFVAEVVVSALSDYEFNERIVLFHEFCVSEEALNKSLSDIRALGPLHFADGLSGDTLSDFRISVTRHSVSDSIEVFE